MKTFYHILFTLLVFVMMLFGCVTDNHNTTIPNDAFIRVSNKTVFPDYIWKGGGYGYSGKFPTPPRIIYAAPAQFPWNLNGVMNYGEATVRFVIEKDGSAGHIQVSEATNRYFAEAAINAVAKYRFNPSVFEGEPVAVISTQKITFGRP